MKYTSYTYNGKTLLNERYLILGEVDCCEDEYDIFDIQIPHAIRKNISKVNNNNYCGFEIFDVLDSMGNNTFKTSDVVNKKIYLYSEIICKTDIKILINLSVLKCKCKLWINNEFVHAEYSLSAHDFINSNFISYNMNEGKNYILIEYFSAEEITRFSLQLRNYNYEISNDFNALSNIKHNKIDPILMIAEPNFRPIESIYKFMYIGNTEKYKSAYTVEIHDSKIGLVKSFEAELGKIVEVNLEELRMLDSEFFRCEEIRCSFDDVLGNVVVEKSVVHINDYSQRIAVVQDIVDSKLTLFKEISEELYDDVYKSITNKLFFYDMFSDPQLLYEAYSIYEMTLQDIEAGTYNYDNKSSGFHEFSLHAELDDRDVTIEAKIPIGYKSNMKYPAFISFPVFFGKSFCSLFPEEYLPEPCLCFEIRPRGLAGGSYADEASTVEALNWILKNFNIDQDRIYLTGFCASGYSVYAFAQNYPHIPAAIFPLDGHPCMETIENVSNIPTYQITSDKYNRERKNAVKRKLQKYGNYHQYEINEMAHNNLQIYLQHVSILNNLLKARRNPYPEQIIFKTFHNRYLESFWVKLHGISKGNKIAKVKAKIKNNELINISINGSNGITINLPPQINKYSFDVVINQKKFHFNDYKFNQIVFRKNKKWDVVDTMPHVDYRKGTGLLDVYLNSLRIIVADEASETTLDIANNFSCPQNNTNLMGSVKYPIYKQSEVPNYIFSHNLILLDNCFNNSYVKRLEDKLIIKYNENGYSYKENTKNGKYVILQVVANPYKPDRSILIISTNEEKLLTKNLFTRKVIIPFYANGFHPYLNNEVLIYTDNKYYGIYEMGNEIIEIA